LWEREKKSPGVFYSVPNPNRSGELILEAWPGIFRQVNPFANFLLISTILSWIEDVLSERILELYSGMGNLTFPISHLAKEVVAVEVNPFAVENAQANARRNETRNIRWIRGSTKGVMQRLLKAGEFFDLVILDPPRSGAWDILEEITTLAPDRMIYISCDPATLSRDLRFLQQNGSYCVERTIPLDMFPQSFHLESITLLQRTNSLK
jgi:23S rRNA (uracil1939-C5)-methyltransferase